MSDAEAEINPAVKAFLEPIRHLLHTRDQRIVDIMINGPGEVWLQIAGQSDYVREPNTRVTTEWAWSLCDVLSNTEQRGFSREMPLLLCSLPGGHRFTALLGPNVVSGLMISIRVRRHVSVPLGKFGLSPEDQDDLASVIEAGGNILVSGGTGTGKTTFINSLAKSIPATKRIVTVEDVNEVLLPHIPNKAAIRVSRTESGTRVTYKEVIDSILRFNPDAIIVGELSVHNAAPAFRLLNSGHGGFMATLHANSPLDALEAWRRNYELAEGRGGEAVVRFLARNIARIVQINFAPDGLTRYCSVAKLDDNGLLDVPWPSLIGNTDNDKVAAALKDFAGHFRDFAGLFRRRRSD